MSKFALVLDLQSQETLSLMTRPPFSGTNPALWVGCDVSTKKGISHHLISLHTTLKRSQTKAEESKTAIWCHPRSVFLHFRLTCHHLFDFCYTCLLGFELQGPVPTIKNHVLALENIFWSQNKNIDKMKMESIHGYEARTYENHCFSSLGDIIYNNGFNQNLFGITRYLNQACARKTTNSF